MRLYIVLHLIENFTACFIISLSGIFSNYKYKTEIDFERTRNSKELWFCDSTIFIVQPEN